MHGYLYLRRMYVLVYNSLNQMRLHMALCDHHSVVFVSSPPSLN